MAVNSVNTESVLRMQMQTGVDGDGDPIYRNKNLYSVKPEALDQDLYDVAQSIGQLQNYALNAVLRIDISRLEEMV